MKIRKALIIATSAVMVITLGLLLSYSCSTPYVTDSAVVITDAFYNQANYHQNETSVLLGEHEGKLYFLIRKYASKLDESKYHKYLSVFENGTAQRLAKVEGMPQAIANGNVYYWKAQFPEGYAADLCSYDIESRTESYIISLDSGPCNISISMSGALHFPKDYDSEEYYTAYSDQTINSSPKPTLQAGEYIYCLAYDTGLPDEAEIMRYDTAGGEKKLSEVPYGKKTLLPCTHGILVHNEGTGNLLYLIENDGSVKKLFTVPCMTSISAVNVYGDYAYLSFLRYEGYGEIGMTRYDNDTLEGTWRINLLNGTKEKISDSIYNGIYIFDNTGIYVCDKACNIYKIDFSGKLTQILLKHNT